MEKMCDLTTNQVVKNYVNFYVEDIRDGNIRGERQELSSYFTRIFGTNMEDTCYIDQIERAKSAAVKANKDGLDKLWAVLVDGLYFSSGNDFSYKTKLEADGYFVEPIKGLTVEGISEEVDYNYDDESFKSDNPNLKRNLRCVSEVVRRHLDFTGLLSYLYCNGFNFNPDWKSNWPTSGDALEVMLRESSLTIGEFIKMLNSDKGSVIRSVFELVKNPILRAHYLQRLDKFVANKNREVDGLDIANLPVGYFLDHTIKDSIGSSQVNEGGRILQSVGNIQ